MFVETHFELSILEDLSADLRFITAVARVEPSIHGDWAEAASCNIYHDLGDHLAESIAKE